MPPSFARLAFGRNGGDHIGGVRARTPLAEGLRREGLHQADLSRFREEILEAATVGFAALAKRSGPTPDQKRVQSLEKELRRKEKALAEAAALLVLRKKVDALFPSEEEGENTNDSDE
jgi:hypothetical protein